MYSHLTKDQRVELAVLRREGFSLRQIAARLGVSHSTAVRELKRNGSSRAWGGYHAGDARRAARLRKAAANKRRIKIRPGSRLEALLIKHISEDKWSPEQVCGRLRRSGRERVCHQTVYDWIYSSKRDLLPELHCRKGRYRRTRADGKRKVAGAEETSKRHVSRRGKLGDKRLIFGHWEGDTVVGKGRSGYVATFVERKSGYLAATVLPKADFGAAGFAAATAEALLGLPAPQLRSLTLDNGPEMAYCERIERHLGLKVYYATPYHSWERGCNENANGLLRYFLPKSRDFAGLTQKELDLAVALINNRPRKRLNWRTPAEILKR